MTKILFPRIGKPYENDLLQHLGGLSLEIVQYTTDDESMDNFCMYFEALCTGDTIEEDVRIIVDIENQDVIKSILQILPLATGLITSRPSFRIIVVTTLLTWCGDSTQRQILDAESGFSTRIPLQSLLDIYALENTLWKVSTDLSTSTMFMDGPMVCFAGVGLLYGRDGGDFASAYRLLWDEMCKGSEQTSSTELGIQLPFLNGSSKDNNVLAVHIDDFLASISYLLLSSTGNNSPMYFPIVDDTTTTIPMTAPTTATTTTRNNTANGSKGGMTQGIPPPILDLSMVNCNAFETNQSVIAAPQDAVVTTLWDDSDNRLMLCNTKIRFASEAVKIINLAKQNNYHHNDQEMKGSLVEDSPSSEYKQSDHPPTSSSSSSSSSGSAWQQFLHYHHLAPCRLLIAGASGSGKSTLAKGLAKELELQYVDVLETLRWVAVSNNGGDDTSTSSSSAPGSSATSSATEIKKTLLDIMTTKLQEGIKKGAPPIVCDPLTFDYSESFVSMVPLPLVRKALAWRISTCSHCQIKGFVLDIWHMSDLLGDVNDLLELLNINNHHNHPPVTAGSPSETVIGVIGQVESSVMTITENEKMETDVIVIELDSKDKTVLLDRYTKSLGVSESDNKAKLSKEIQASLKTFETRLDKYWSSLRETPVKSSVNTSEDKMTGDLTGTVDEAAAVSSPSLTRLSHNVLIDAQQKVNFRYSVIEETYQITPEDVLIHVKDYSVRQLHGDMGWLNQHNNINNNDNPSGDDVQPTLNDPMANPTNISSESTDMPISSSSSSLRVSSKVMTSTTTIATNKKGDDLQGINQNISTLGLPERRGLVLTCSELLEYMEVNVTPFLSKCLVIIEREQPPDPIAYLIEYMKKQSANNIAEAREAAHHAFLNELEEAEERYNNDHILKDNMKELLGK